MGSICKSEEKVPQNVQKSSVNVFDIQQVEAILAQYLPKDESIMKYEKMGRQSMGAILQFDAFNSLGFTYAGEFDLKAEVMKEGQKGERAMREAIIVGHSTLLKLHTLLHSLNLKEKLCWKLLHFAVIFGKSADDPIPKGCFTYFTRETAPKLKKLEAESALFVYNHPRMTEASRSSRPDMNPLLSRIYVDKTSFLQELKKFVVREDDELVRHAVVLTIDRSSGSTTDFDEMLEELNTFTRTVLEEEDLLSVLVFNKEETKFLTKN